MSGQPNPLDVLRMAARYYDAASHEGGALASLAQVETLVEAARELNERAARELLNALPLTDGASRRAIDREFIGLTLIPDGLMALDGLRALARLAQSATERSAELSRDAAEARRERGGYLRDFLAARERSESAEAEVARLRAELNAEKIDKEFVLQRAGALVTGVGIARVRLADGDIGEAANALEDAVAKCPSLDEFLERYRVALAAVDAPQQETGPEEERA